MHAGCTSADPLHDTRTGFRSTGAMMNHCPLIIIIISVALAGGRRQHITAGTEGKGWRTKLRERETKMSEHHDDAHVAGMSASLLPGTDAAGANKLDDDEEQQSLSLKENGAAPPVLELSFDSCGWMYVYHFGAARCFAETLDLSHESMRFAGSSAGGLCAAALACGVDPSLLQQDVMSAHAECPTAWDVYCKMVPLARSGSANHATENAHLLASGRLAIALTGSMGTASTVVTQFESRTHFLEVLAATCHVPVVGGVLPSPVTGSDGRKKYYYDGGIAWPMPTNCHADSSNLSTSATGREEAHIALPFPTATTWGILPPREEVMHDLHDAAYLQARQYLFQHRNEFRPWLKKNPAPLDASEQNQLTELLDRIRAAVEDRRRLEKWWIPPAVLLALITVLIAFPFVAVFWTGRQLWLVVKRCIALIMTRRSR